VDYVKSAQLLSRFSKRSIRNQPFAVANAHRGRSRHVLQSLTGHEVLRLHNALGEASKLLVYRAKFRFAQVIDVSFVSVDQ
jgi:hypothetical protein